MVLSISKPFAAVRRQFGTEVGKKLRTEPFSFVPKHLPVSENDVELLREFINKSRRLFVLTGAGISTESGIPDYRSEEVGLYARSNHKPIQYNEYLRSEVVRRRYWARNYVGWDRFSGCQPNATHISIANLELALKKVSVVVTQNVDGLHLKAGSTNVIEVHGTAYQVVCLRCERTYDRRFIQKHLKSVNRITETSGMIRPDGDVEIPVELIEKFEAPICFNCGGVLKPDIVFFGDNVPKQKVKKIKYFLSESDGMLVLGTSLSVFSAYRIVLQALEERKPIVVVNIGPTRADQQIDKKISAKCGDILPKIC